MDAAISTTGELSGINLDNIRLSNPGSNGDSDGHSESGESFESATHGPSIAVDDDNDAPPSFPALNSAQRQSSSSNQASVPTSGTSKTTSFLQSVAPRSSASNTLMAPPMALVPPRGGGLAAPPSTSALTAPVGVGGASGVKGGKSRKKVALAPGCSPLDWARLKNSTDLRGGVTSLLRVSPSELKKHNKLEDAWSAFYGKVYNITPYLRFHPGGEDELMRCAGRDGTRLFALTHSWVNIDSMIDTAMVGVLTGE
ncbi:uncharacterized protein MEPE_05726 [Melanopsichium pennsylvanicum]|uniref:Cytochrome b5 heme-binding domain-containing protein n=2 Tax=Melanopsichium pennsylvanicum TaxID=63383 RepID=A0AAJ5C7K7_9BASI|nr:conserved hypothetical protein [Melanopsichium pennsylvanicum 4]SNX87016.1 uncharacterized protein MEPE_05726 [Melanopsichium pennsylvanicum]